MSSLLPEESSFTCQGPAGHLEAYWMEPSEVKAQAIIIFCHPHPLFGGTCQNKVITTAVRAARDIGCRGLRFNFRGGGLSEGVFDQGEGELADLLAVMQAIRDQKGADLQFIVVGFSFGAYIAYKAALAHHVQGLICIAPPVSSDYFLEKQGPTLPWAVLLPEADEVIAPQAVRDWVKQISPAPVFITFPEASHFFHGKLTILKTELMYLLEKMINVNS